MYIFFLDYAVIYVLHENSFNSIIRVTHYNHLLMRTYALFKWTLKYQSEKLIKIFLKEL